MSQSILKMEQIVKSFGAVNVLKGVDFDLAKGEVHCICWYAYVFLAGTNHSGQKDDR